MDDATPIPHTPATRLRAAFDLTKPGITLYVMITTGVSAYVASRGAVSVGTAFQAILGTGLATAGALALNQYVERGADARMVRTRGRPLPSHRMTPAQALVVGVLLLAGGLGYLAYRSGWWPAGVATLSAVMYLGVYTPLKSRSYMATLAGAVPGALPTLIGWSAATGSLEPAAVALLAIAYLWQLPHVLGLAWMLRDDYARVGFKLIPRGGAPVIGMHMVAATAALLPACVVPSFLGYTGGWYVAGALAATAGFLSVAVAAARNMTDRSARRLFLASLLYHPVLLGLMMLDTVRL